MNPQIKKQWLEALRGGNYKQGSGALKQNDSYCCLGVLCDLYSKEHPISWIPSKEPFHDLKSRFLGKLWYLPDEVISWAQLPFEDPIVNGFALSYWNDNSKTFNEIADLIEKHL